MNFLRFEILVSNVQEAHSQQEDVIAINEKHIVSIKPIQMVHKGDVLKGFWIRTTNGKKYRAISVPDAVRSLFKEEDFSILSE